MKYLIRLWIGLIGFGLLTLLAITGTSNPHICYAESIATDGVAIKWSEGASLEFSGMPNEVQTGEVTFTVDADSRCKKLLCKVNGTAFADENTVLDTEYRVEGESSWHKAGEPFTVHVVPGVAVKIHYRASMGGIITTQKAGSYNAKVSIRIIPAQ